MRSRLTTRELEQAQQLADVRAANVSLMRQLTKAKASKEELVAAVYRAAKDAALSFHLPETPAPKRDRRHGSESAIAVLSDWQLAKALDDDTPILTTSGWTKHGALVPGDYVYGPDGLPKQVLGITGSRPQECFRIVFDSDAELTATGDHLWAGWRRYKDSGSNVYCRRRVLWTTEKIASLKLTRRENREYVERAFHVDLPQALAFPVQNLPIEPYILGVWLGDGYSASGRFCAGLRDVEWFKQFGDTRIYGGRIAVIRVPSLYESLRDCGLVNNKSIPQEYLTASPTQRLALLQGLMDTDGTISPEGLCSFSSTNPLLASGVAWLATSLGMKVSYVTRQGKLHGQSHRSVGVVGFTPHCQVFRLPRKVQRLHFFDNEHQTRFRFVQSVEPVGTRSAQCLLVEGGLYLAGEHLIVTHNTTATYNSAICEQRIEKYGDKVIELSDIQRADHPVNDLRVYLLGDIVEGELIFPGQAHLVDASLYDQVLVSGRRILCAFLRKMLLSFDTVSVVGVIGNHGALGGKARRDYHPESNADAMLYEACRLILKGDTGTRAPRLRWTDNRLAGRRKWYAVDVVGDCGFLLFHGDQIKGGYADYPWYGFGKKIMRWRNGGIPEEFHYALSGHFHTPGRHLFGRVRHWASGSTESSNEYAAERIGNQGDPSQWLLFCNGKRVTAEYEVDLR